MVIWTPIGGIFDVAAVQKEAQEPLKGIQEDLQKCFGSGVSVGTNASRLKVSTWKETKVAK